MSRSSRKIIFWVVGAGLVFIFWNQIKAFFLKIKAKLNPGSTSTNGAGSSGTGA